MIHLKNCESKNKALGLKAKKYTFGDRVISDDKQWPPHKQDEWNRQAKIERQKLLAKYQKNIAVRPQEAPGTTIA